MKHAMYIYMYINAVASSVMLVIFYS